MERISRYLRCTGLIVVVVCFHLPFLGEGLSGCFLQDVDYYGNDVTMYHDVFLPHECQMLCYNNIHCFYWTYAPSLRMCFLKTEAAPTVKWHDEDRISGPKECKDCLLQGVDFYGHDVVIVQPVTIATACQEECALDEKCYHFSFSPSLRMCFLKNFNAPANTVNNHDRVSGPKFCPPPKLCGDYYPLRKYEGANIFSEHNFWFFTDDDPTQGFVNYVDKRTAVNDELIHIEPDGRAIINVDTSNQLSYATRGRDSVRLTSNEAFENGLWVLDLNHMPTGCGTWPAFWTVGHLPWPTEGEIDIIEGVNKQTNAHVALHTTQGCHMHVIDESKFSGLWSPNGSGDEARDCYHAATPTNVGCALDGDEEGSFGAALNANNGGYYVMELDQSSLIRIWYFTHNDAPPDLKEGTPNPDTWEENYKLLPIAHFPLFHNCNGESYFGKQRMVINLTFCGMWVVTQSLWSSDCSFRSEKECHDFVRNNPQAFSDAYWDINRITIYRKDECAA